MSPNDELLDCAIVACRNPRSRSALCQEMALRFKKRAGTGRNQMGRGVAVQRPVVLIVEDEMLLRLDAIVMVEQAGFEGIAASDADEAIRILESRTDVKAVITDVQMPGTMDG